jgi:hypothetical protein
MSLKTQLLDAITTILNDKTSLNSKKKFIKLVGDEFDKIYNNNKKEKKLNSYQLFMKEQMSILNERENNKSDGEIKLKKSELLSEIAKLWKLHKDKSEAEIKDKSEAEVKEEIKQEVKDKSEAEVKDKSEAEVKKKKVTTKKLVTA